MTRLPIAAMSIICASPVIALDRDAGMHAFRQVAGETCIPADPQRIITLQDQNGPLPLMEPGVKRGLFIE